MNFELEQNRVLLSTLSAGTGIDLKVGGTLAAQTGSKEADGNLQADRMTKDGVIKGSDRQQVSVTHTDNKAGTTVNGPTSQVLGNLAAQGIRSGANDSLSPGAVKSGQDAVNALLNSGLLTVKNSPGVQAALAAPTPNGAATTYTDASGKVSLTVAGQAKVQEVYNQLKLTETFDVKHFADQQTAQIVTLIAAVALTICSGGAGAGLIGAVAGSMQATVANAVFISMMSTMTGQLAGGASFSDAFQSGVKAGATSAFTAGVGYGVSDSLGLAPTGADTAGNLTYSDAAKAYYAQSAIDKLSDSRFWTMASANATASGIASVANGGRFDQGFAGSLAASLGSTANSAVGDWAKANGIDDGSLAKMALHSGIGAAQAKASGRDALAGAIGGATAEALSRVNTDLDWVTGNKLASQLLTAAASAGANTLLNKNANLSSDLTAAYQGMQADTFNRQLHSTEQTTAKKLYALAQKNSLPYTLADIEDALRMANYKGESITTNIVVNPNAPDGLNAKSSTDMYSGKAEDLMIPGQTTNATRPWLTDGKGTLQQNLGFDGGVKAPSGALVAFINANSSDYTWASSSVAQTPVDSNAGKAWTSNGYIQVGNSNSPFAPGWGTGASLASYSGQPNIAPDYLSVQGNLYVLSGGVAINLHNGEIFGQWGLGRAYPYNDLKPGVTLTAGSVLTKSDSQVVGDFLKGAAGTASFYYPVPALPIVGVGGAINHSYGGNAAVEMGISVPPGAAVSPFNYGFDSKKKE